MAYYVIYAIQMGNATANPRITVERDYHHRAAINILVAPKKE